MKKGSLLIDFSGYEIFENIASKFGNGAHILISKKYFNKKLKVIVGKSVKIKNNKIEIDFFGNEILERNPSKFGTGFHIIVPKENIGKKIKILVKKSRKKEVKV
jgi:putative transposon-encoded protein